MVFADPGAVYTRTILILLLPGLLHYRCHDTHRAAAAAAAAGRPLLGQDTAGWFRGDDGGQIDSSLPRPEVSLVAEQPKRLRRLTKILLSQIVATRRRRVISCGTVSLFTHSGGSRGNDRHVQQFLPAKNTTSHWWHWLKMYNQSLAY